MILDMRAMASDPPELIERYRRGIKFDCFVDGKVIPFSFYADTTEGLVKAYLPDKSGQLRTCTDHSIIGEYEVRGKVEIKRRPVLGNRAPGDTTIQGPTAEEEISGTKTKPVYGG